MASRVRKYGKRDDGTPFMLPKPKAPSKGPPRYGQLLVPLGRKATTEQQVQAENDWDYHVNTVEDPDDLGTLIEPDPEPPTVPSYSPPPEDPRPRSRHNTGPTEDDDENGGWGPAPPAVPWGTRASSSSYGYDRPTGRPSYEDDRWKEEERLKESRSRSMSSRNGRGNDENYGRDSGYDTYGAGSSRRHDSPPRRSSDKGKGRERSDSRGREWDRDRDRDHPYAPASYAASGSSRGPVESTRINGRPTFPDYTRPSLLYNPLRPSFDTERAVPPHLSHQAHPPHQQQHRNPSPPRGPRDRQSYPPDPRVLVPPTRTIPTGPRSSTFQSHSTSSRPYDSPSTPVSLRPAQRPSPPSARAPTLSLSQASHLPSTLPIRQTPPHRPMPSSSSEPAVKVEASELAQVEQPVEVEDVKVKVEDKQRERSYHPTGPTAEYTAEQFAEWTDQHEAEEKARRAEEEEEEQRQRAASWVAGLPVKDEKEVNKEEVKQEIRENEGRSKSMGEEGRRRSSSTDAVAPKEEQLQDQFKPTANEVQLLSLARSNHSNASPPDPNAARRFDRPIQPELLVASSSAAHQDSSTLHPNESRGPFSQTFPPPRESSLVQLAITIPRQQPQPQQHLPLSPKKLAISLGSLSAALSPISLTSTGLPDLPRRPSGSESVKRMFGDDGEEEEEEEAEAEARKRKKRVEEKLRLEEAENQNDIYRNKREERVEKERRDKKHRKEKERKQRKREREEREKEKEREFERHRQDLHGSGSRSRGPDRSRDEREERVFSPHRDRNSDADSRGQDWSPPPRRYEDRGRSRSRSRSSDRHRSRGSRSPSSRRNSRSPVHRRDSEPKPAPPRPGSPSPSRSGLSAHSERMVVDAPHVERSSSPTEDVATVESVQEKEGETAEEASVEQRPSRRPRQVFTYAGVDDSDESDEEDEVVGALATPNEVFTTGAQAEESTPVDPKLREVEENGSMEDDEVSEESIVEERPEEACPVEAHRRPFDPPFAHSSVQTQVPPHPAPPPAPPLPDRNSSYRPPPPPTALNLYPAPQPALPPSFFVQPGLNPNPFAPPPPPLSLQQQAFVHQQALVQQQQQQMQQQRDLQIQYLQQQQQQQLLYQQQQHQPFLPPQPHILSFPYPQFSSHPPLIPQLQRQVPPQPHPGPQAGLTDEQTLDVLAANAPPGSQDRERLKALRPDVVRMIEERETAKEKAKRQKEERARLDPRLRGK